MSEPSITLPERGPRRRHWWLAIAAVVALAAVAGWALDRRGPDL